MEDKESDEQWENHQGDPLHPDRWFKGQLDKDAESSNEKGRCLGIRCLAWDRCEKASEMRHSLFGGSEHRTGVTKGWGALSLPAMAAGAPKFHGGLAVLKHLWIKIAEYLHVEHGQMFPSARLPRSTELLTLRQVM